MKLTLVIVDLLARLIAGEATDACGVTGKLAVAHVWANRQAAGMVGGWYGDKQPGYLDELVARNFQHLTDPTAGALFLFSDGDMRLPAVQQLTARRTLTVRIDCGPGAGLNAWR